MDAEFLTSALHESQYPAPDRPEVAFAGRSNVGKSSLINTLTNRKKLAYISSTPGKTQCLNFFRVDKLYFVDLPGYGFSRVPLRIQASWRSMVETYLQHRPTLKLVVVLLDIRRNPGPEDLDLLEWLSFKGISSHLVLNKADKLSRQKARQRSRQIAQQLAALSAEPPSLFSAKNRQGIRELWDRINHAAHL